jgi:predicted ABC-type ATPase
MKPAYHRQTVKRANLKRGQDIPNKQIKKTQTKNKSLFVQYLSLFTKHKMNDNFDDFPSIYGQFSVTHVTSQSLF